MNETEIVEAGPYHFRIHGGPRATPQRSAIDERVRIQKSGEIHIPQRPMEEIGSPQWVELLYDPQKHVLGLRPTESTNSRAFSCRTDKKRSHMHIIAGRAFTLTNSIDTSVTRRYPWEVVDGILVVDLNAGDSLTNRGRREERAS